MEALLRLLLTGRGEAKRNQESKRENERENFRKRKKKYAHERQGEKHEGREQKEWKEDVVRLGDEGETEAFRP